MRWSIRIFRIAGTEVRIHFTFLLFLFWVGLALTQTSGVAVAMHAVLLLLLIFLCVLLHEFGHVAAALRFGIPTPAITLYPIGGIAGIKRIPDKPSQELVVAVAGPAVNLFIAAVLLLVTGGAMPDKESIGVGTDSPILEQLVVVNLFLGIFNLVPAFPMDGGRMLRSILAMYLPRVRATELAARIGQGFAVGGGVVAMALQQPFLFIIAIFIFFAAGSESSAVQIESVLEGMDANDAGLKEFHTLEMSDTVHHAVDLILDTSQDEFPVINSERQCIGIATRDDVMRVLRDKGAEAMVSDVVNNIPPQIDGKLPVREAMRILAESGLPAAAVVDQEGKLDRWLTMNNLRDLILARSASAEFVRSE